MANDMCTRRLTRELQSLQKNPITSPRIHTVPNESNILEWHYVIEGNTGTPYYGGYYHGKLIFPKEYPLKPPSVLMLTPSGRFKPNRRLCLSMSDFHPESWNPMWSVSTILTGLYSFMIENGTTLGSIDTSDTVKRKLATESLGFNVRDATFCKLFPDLKQTHDKLLLELEQQRRQQQLLSASKGITSGTNALSSLSLSGIATGGAQDEEEMQSLMAIAAGAVALLSILFALRFF
jgi:ubiquitin-conjugating enzyme E2 J2